MALAVAVVVADAADTVIVMVALDDADIAVGIAIAVAAVVAAVIQFEMIYNSNSAEYY